MEPWSDSEFRDAFLEAIDNLDGPVVEDMVGQLVEHLGSRTEPFPPGTAKDILLALRKKRYFFLMARTADAFLRSGASSSQIKRQYAQSLLDLDHVSAAIAVLQEVAKDNALDTPEGAEARGLIGRAYKQTYITADDPVPQHNQQALRDSVNAYFEVYQRNPDRHLWHGINAVSLINRAQRDGIEDVGRQDADDIARNIVERIQEKERYLEATVWDLATAAEAYVNLGNYAAAGRYLQQYVAHPMTDAFELATTLKQFEQVCQLDAHDGEERFLMDMLRTELMRKDDGAITSSVEQVRSVIAEGEARQDGLERVLGDTTYQSHRWFLEMMKRARSVGRVWHGVRGIGSGFLIGGEQLKPEWQDLQVFVTNNHVISADPDHPIAIPPEAAEITFDILYDQSGNQPRFRVAEVLCESNFTDLDFTCLTLDKAVAESMEMPMTIRMPSGSEERIYVIGHPLGGELSYSFQDNRLVGKTEKYLHYRSPTDPGSSGSPLFNSSWELIGIHHRSVQNANEGISLPAMVAAIQQNG